MAKRPIDVTPKTNTPNNNNYQNSSETLRQAAIYIVGAILLALIGYFGWTYIQNSGMKIDTEAADNYSAIEEANSTLVNAGDENTEAKEQLSADIDALVAEHGSTVYAWQALMIKARYAVDANNLDEALDALSKASAIELDDAGLQAVTELRYATVLLARGDLEEALAHASKEMPGAFEASQQELLGDIYMAEGSKDEAIRSYNNAWSLIAKREEQRPLLQLKLQNLGINPEPIDVPSLVSQPAANTAPVMQADSQQSEDATAMSDTPVKAGTATEGE